MPNRTVLGCTVGAGVLLLFCAAMFSVALLGAAAIVSADGDAAPDAAVADTRWLPADRIRDRIRDSATEPQPTDEVGDAVLGPLNTKALNESKSGGLLRRIFSRGRSTANCQPYAGPVNVARCVPCNAPMLIAPTACVPCGIGRSTNCNCGPNCGCGPNCNCGPYCPGNCRPAIGRKIPEQPALVKRRPGFPNSGWLYPAAIPDFTRAPRGEVKTGGFACANCGRVCVGQDWATDWDSGNPVTFCCRQCWERMTAMERRACFENWSRRQAAGN